MTDIIKLRFTHPGNKKGVVKQFFTLREAQREVRLSLGPDIEHDQARHCLTNKHKFGEVWLVEGGGMVSSLDDLINKEWT